MEKALIAALSALSGFIIGLFGPPIIPAFHQAQQSEMSWLTVPTPFSLNPVSRPTVTPRPTSTPSTPPTLTAKPPEPTIEPTPKVSKSFIIPLKGGGEMTVNADSHEAAINNVKSSGAIPAD